MCGYQIAAWPRDKDVSDIAEGTVYALVIRIDLGGLADVPKVPTSAAAVVRIDLGGLADVPKVPSRVATRLACPTRSSR